VVQSLNISVACAVSLYEAFRQRNLSGMYDERQFSDGQFERMQQDWYMR
jgi:tRNA (guanosine-2'-O-)-methyltransferase